jgi:hypothetical protein
VSALSPRGLVAGRRKFQDMRIAVTLVIAALTAALGVAGAASARQDRARTALTSQNIG